MTYFMDPVVACEHTAETKNIIRLSYGVGHMLIYMGVFRGFWVQLPWAET